MRNINLVFRDFVEGARDFQKKKISHKLCLTQCPPHVFVRSKSRLNGENLLTLQLSTRDDQTSFVTSQLSPSGCFRVDDSFAIAKIAKK